MGVVTSELVRPHGIHGIPLSVVSIVVGSFACTIAVGNFVYTVDKTMDNLNEPEQRKPGPTDEEKITFRIDQIIRSFSAIIWAWAWLHWKIESPTAKRRRGWIEDDKAPIKPRKEVK